MPIDFANDVFRSHNAKHKAVIHDVPERLRQDRMGRSRVLELCILALGFGSDLVKLESGTLRFRDSLNRERRFVHLRLDDGLIEGSLAPFHCVTEFARKNTKTSGSHRHALG